MQRPSVNGTPASGGAVSLDKVWEKLPSCLMYLKDVKYDDGSDRQPSTLSIFIEDGLWKVALNDREMKQSLYVSGGTFLEALQSLEKALASNTGGWRTWKGQKKK